MRKVGLETFELSPCQLAVAAPMSRAATDQERNHIRPPLLGRRLITSGDPRTAYRNSVRRRGSAPIRPALDPRDERRLWT